MKLFQVWIEALQVWIQAFSVWIEALAFASVCTRPWHAGAPGVSHPPTLTEASKPLEKLHKRLRTMGGTLTSVSLHQALDVPGLDRSVKSGLKLFCFGLKLFRFGLNLFRFGLKCFLVWIVTY